jgi:hypothetical protein
MSATRSHTRTPAYYDSPDLKLKPAKTPPPEPKLPEPQPVPVGPITKLEALSEAYFEALQLLRTHLKHPDAKIAGRAAMKIMDLQLATLRHKTNVLGTTLPDDVRPTELSDEMISNRFGWGPDEEAMDPTDAKNRRDAIDEGVREKQREADVRGLGEFVTSQAVRFEYDQLHPTTVPSLASASRFHQRE